MNSFKRIIDILFPPSCPVCAKPLGYQEGKRLDICPPCRKKLVYITLPFCLKCGKQLREKEKEFCYDCTKKPHVFDRGVAVYAYTDGIKQSIYRFKYHDCREYASFYGREAAQRFAKQVAAWKIDAIVPVPLYRAKQRVRGYNQAELIADALGEWLGIRVEPSLLIRSKKTIPMKQLNDTERIKNVENAFHITKNVVKYKSILLIDDIYTTGATLDACAEVLKKHGVQSVYFLCLCIGQGL